MLPMKRLEYEGERPTLDGKVVEGAERLGPPVMAYWFAKEVNGKVEVDESRDPQVSFPWAPPRANAYALAVGHKPVEIRVNNDQPDKQGRLMQDTRDYFVRIRKWTAIQFYRIPEEAL